MSVFLREKTTRDLIRELYVDIDGLVVEWESKMGEFSDFPIPRQRSSLERWISKGVPSKKSEKSQFQLLAFCALLDVDPLAIFDFDRNGFFSDFNALRTAMQTGVAGMGALAPLFEFYKPDENWPSNELALKCFHRPWYGYEFSTPDDAYEVGYALIKVSFNNQTRNRPRAVHIAWRRKNSPAKMWRFFGTVLALDEQLELYADDGAYSEMVQVNAGEIIFRTYFGRGSAEFRVASIHEFKCSIEFPFDDMSVIGFNW